MSSVSFSPLCQANVSAMGPGSPHDRAVRTPCASVATCVEPWGTSTPWPRVRVSCWRHRQEELQLLFKPKPGRERSTKDSFLKSRAWRHVWGMPEAQLLPRARVTMLPALCCPLQWGRSTLLLRLFKVWRNLVLQRGWLSRKNCACRQSCRKRLQPVSMPLGGSRGAARLGSSSKSPFCCAAQLGDGAQPVPLERVCCQSCGCQGSWREPSPSQGQTMAGCNGRERELRAAATLSPSLNSWGNTGLYRLSMTAKEQPSGC